ncbi:glycerophosphodiester phosphodiesterase family protein [Tropicimonas marinistellae]|uniref:glycerophosphodiester phosphodiesterase family protein n=1 Tax=Tropicimonas marinistellae TaxID=1739787 RepID=UPI000834B161|nr:glycerophosphodiester phosphodiesterase family protein [Tropicimonas marinistellae]
MRLPASFLARPIAHRALHDLAAGRPENSRAAVEAAIAAGYGIEIDLQMSADEQALVFHDRDLNRLTGVRGPIRRRTAEELSGIRLLGSSETIPTFGEVLALVGGRVPLLVEIKDQDGALGPGVGALERAAASAAADYTGPLAFMSFNPNAMIELGRIFPDSVRGLTTSGFSRKDWPMVPAAVRKRLATIPDLEAAGACFVSHDAKDLDRDDLLKLRAKGLPVLCWTIRSPAAEAAARRFADNVTFEGYLAA